MSHKLLYRPVRRSLSPAVALAPAESGSTTLRSSPLLNNLSPAFTAHFPLYLFVHYYNCAIKKTYPERISNPAYCTLPRLFTHIHISRLQFTTLPRQLPASL
ncbi:hypothetical protein HRR79_001688 [Exophiala dermatitidis]|nr:hypothetical protein HRR79_001688 [Exophiala dermatitidis]